MQTDELIAVMTAGHRPVDTGWLRRATGLCALAALALTVLLVLIVLGPRPDFAGAWSTSPVIAKALLGASIAGTALVLFQRSLRPGLKPGRKLPLVALPVALVVAWALATLAQMERTTARTCTTTPRILSMERYPKIWTPASATISARAAIVTPGSQVWLKQ